MGRTGMTDLRVIPTPTMPDTRVHTCIDCGTLVEVIEIPLHINPDTFTCHTCITSPPEPGPATTHRST